VSKSLRLKSAHQIFAHTHRCRLGLSEELTAPAALLDSASLVTYK